MTWGARLGLGGGFPSKQLMALAQEVVIGHAGDIVADHAMAGRMMDGTGAGTIRQSEIGVKLRHTARVFHIELEERVKRRHRAVAVFGNGWMRVEMGIEESLQGSVLFCALG